VTEQTKSKRPFRRSQAANYVTDTYNVPCSSRTLAKLACVGGGPLYRLAGRFPLYEPEDLDAWVRARMSAKRRTTCEPGLE